MFKISLISKPKFELKGTTTKCTIHFNINGLKNYIMHGPNRWQDNCNFTKKHENHYLSEIANLVYHTIIRKMIDKDIIKIKDDIFGNFYITAEAKLNPEDKFDKTIGRKVAETKAEMKIRKLEQYIISELTEMAHRLYDCAQNADEVCAAKMMTTSMSLDTIIN